MLYCMLVHVLNRGQNVRQALLLYQVIDDGVRGRGEVVRSIKNTTGRGTPLLVEWIIRDISHTAREGYFDVM